MATILRVDSALLNCVGHAVDGQHVRGDAVVYVVGFGVADYVVEGVDHDVFELLVDYGFFPEVSLAVLHPFKIGRGDAAGVAEDVGDDEDFFVGEDFVCFGGGGAVGAFGEDAALHAVGVLAGDLVFGGGGDKDFAIGQQQLGGVGGLGFGES